MGQVVIHAGRPKTGSTSVQAWLATRARWLWEQHGTRVVVARVGTPGSSARELTLATPRLPRLEAGRLAKLYDARGARHELDEQLIGQLDARARRARLTVVSSEALAAGLHRLDEGFLSRLDELGQRHELRVAYYVRPQHTALEAAWRQWGFRSDQAPSRFVALRSGQLEYLDTWLGVRERAPSVSFEVRPFRPDLLRGGNVIDDFAGHFLGLTAATTLSAPFPGTWRNRGLPLDVANVLGRLPPGLLWRPGHGNRRLDAVRALIAHLDVPESEAARRSRLVLQSYAHRRFEDGNRTLISQLGWPTEAFVPPVDGDQADATLDVSCLDELWSPEIARRQLTDALRGYAAARRTGAHRALSRQ